MLRLLMPAKALIGILCLVSSSSSLPELRGPTVFKRGPPNHDQLVNQVLNGGGQCTLTHFVLASIPRRKNKQDD